MLLTTDGVHAVRVVERDGGYARGVILHQVHSAPFESRQELSVLLLCVAGHAPLERLLLLQLLPQASGAASGDGPQHYAWGCRVGTERGIKEIVPSEITLH